MEPRLEMVREERAEHEDPPQAEDDARDGGERLDEGADDPPRAARRELAQVERDRDRERRRNHERDEGRDRCAVDERQRTEVLVHRVPGPRDDEVEPEPRERRVCEVEDLVDDRDQRGDAGESARERQSVQQDVAEPITQPATRYADRGRRRDGVHSAASVLPPALDPRAGHHLVTSSSPGFFPCRKRQRARSR